MLGSLKSEVWRREKGEGRQMSEVRSQKKEEGRRKKGNRGIFFEK